MKTLYQVAAIVLLSAIFYFGHRLYQAQLGQQAVDALQFPQMTFEEALRQAQTENKWLIADYSAIWCPSCRRLDEQVFADEKVNQTIREQFVYVRLEYDSEAGLAFAKQHDLQGFPRILVLNESGEKMIELPLVFEAQTYYQNLQSVLSMRYGR